MCYCFPVSIPTNLNNKVNASMSPKTDQEREEMKNILMREAISSLMYLMAMTRGNMAYAVNHITDFVSDPGRGH